MYPNEFPPEPPPPMVDPTLLAVLVLAVVALAAIAFLLGRWTGQNRREDPGAHLKAIHKRIDEALGKAQTATGEEVFPRARALSEAIRDGLEGVAVFGGPLRDRWRGLEAALDGQSPGSHDHHHDDHGDGQGDHGGGGHGSSGEATGPISVSAGTVVIANAVSSGSGGHPPQPPIPHREKVSAAVRDFAEWWKGPTNSEEMKAAQADLLPK